MIRNSFIFLLVIVVALLAWKLYPHAPYSLAHIDIADTEEERVQGLSGKSVLPDDYGMLFVFPSQGKYGFWMKDMMLPIDIIWLSEKGEVLSVSESVATSTYPEVFRPASPARAVLEVRAGLARERGWATSTVLSLPLKK